MEHPFHDDLHGAVPMFGRNGTALNADERAAIAKKRGLCVRCGTKTHGGNILRKVPLNNDDVYQGTCIKCNPQQVPAAVLAEWESRNRPAQTSSLARFRGTARAVQYASHGAKQHSVASMQSRPQAPRPGGPGPANVITADVTPVAASQPPRMQLGHRSASGASTSRLGIHRAASEMPKQATQPKPTLSHNHSMPIPSHQKPPTTTPAATSRGSQHSLDSEDFQSSPEEDSFSLLKTLREKRDDPDAIARALHGIRNLGDDQAGALRDIKAIMEVYRENHKLMALSIGAVWGIVASNDSKKEEAVESGCVEMIIDAIRNGSTMGDAETVQWALGCLTLLAHANGCKQFIAERGGIEAIVDALHYHQSNASVFEWACRALHAMVVDLRSGSDSSAFDKNIVTITEAKGVATIVGSMKYHTSESLAQLWATRLLWRLLDRSDEVAADRTCKNMLDEGCVSVCVKVVKARSTTRELFMLASELICVLLFSGDSGSSYETALDSISTCVRLMGGNSADAEFVGCCIRLLAAVATGSDDSRRMIEETNGIGLVTDAMARNSSDLELLESGFRLIWVLSSDFDPAHLRKICQLIDSIASSHADNSTLTLSICGIVANLCISIQNINPFELPVDSIMRISTSTSDSEVREEASRALSTICSTYPQITDRLDAEVSERFIEGLCSSREGIQASCCSALTAIAKHSEERRLQIFSSGCLETAAAGLLVTGSEAMAVNLLELISALVTSKVKKVMQLPNQVIQAALTAMQVYPGITMIACATMRNLMLVQVPGFSSMNVEGLVETLTQIIDSQSSSLDLITEACGTVWAFAAKHSKHLSSSLSELFRSLLGLMAMHKGDGTPFNAAIETVAAGALASVLQRARETPFAVPDNDIDMIISILDLSIEYDVANSSLMERLLDVILSLSYMAKDILIQFGVIVVVIDCMVEHEHNEVLQQKGCAILALLASTENLQVNLSIAETDGIDMIVSALAVFSENVEIQVDACRALSHLSIDHESRMLISSQGGLILLVNAMNTFMDDINLLGAACSALLNLSADAEEQVLSGSNAVETVVKVMRHQPNSPTLQEKGLGVLQNVSMRSKDAKRAIAEAGGIDAVTFAIKEFMGSPTVLERAFTTMWSLAVLEENQVRIADAGGINLVINGMMANITYEKVQKQACGCLCTLSSNSRNKTLIREVGGVDAIVYSMWAHYNSDSLQIEACRALSSLAVNVQTSEVMIASDGEISAIMSAMRRFPESERLQEHACVALRNFLLSADNAELVRNSRVEVEKLMNHATTMFPDRCSERAKQVMASLQ